MQALLPVRICREVFGVMLSTNCVSLPISATELRIIHVHVLLFLDLTEVPFLPASANRTLLSSTAEDSVSSSIPIPGGLPFGNRNQTTAYVCRADLNNVVFYPSVV